MELLGKIYIINICTLRNTTRRFTGTAKCMEHGKMNFVKNLFGRKIEFSNKDIFCIAITAIYALITLVLVAHHEPFEDEVNVWMILHNLKGFAMWKHIFDDGNPPGFFMLLLPFVKSGLSYLSVKMICWLSCVLSVFLLNRFSPFPVFLNVIITFSAPMLYAYPVIARCYSLLPLLIILAAMLYPSVSDSDTANKGNHNEICAVLYLLVLAAIAQNHVIMFAFAGLMFALFAYQRFYKAGERRLPVIAAAFAVFIALAAIVFQSVLVLKTHIGYKIPNPVNLTSLKNVILPFFSCFFDMASCTMFSGGIDNIKFIFKISVTVSIFVVLLILYCLYKKNKTFFFICLAGIIFPLYIYITRRSVVFPNRVFIVHLFFIFFFWIIIKNSKILAEKSYGKILIASLSFLFLLSVPSGIAMSFSDFNGNFSSAMDIADFIKVNIPDDGKSIIVSPGSWQGVPVAYYLYPRPVFALNGKQIKHIEAHSSTLENHLAESGITKGKNYIYIVASKYQRENLASSGYTFIYETTPAIIMEEDYVLYRIP